MALLEVRGLTRSFYGVQALSGLDLQVQAGTITALIGPNGAGKTTAFGCISGVVPPDGGRVTLDGRDITGWRPDQVARAGLTRTFQVARGIPRLSVIENLLLYAPGLPGERRLPALLGGGRRQARAPAAPLPAPVIASRPCGAAQGAARQSCRSLNCRGAAPLAMTWNGQARRWSRPMPPAQGVAGGRRRPSTNTSNRRSTLRCQPAASEP